MEERISLPNPHDLIIKYQKALKNFIARTGSNFFILSLIPAINYNSLLAKIIEEFIQSLFEIYNSVQDDAKLFTALMEKQLEFTRQLNSFTSHRTFLEQDTPITHFLKMLREQFRFQTDQQGERLKELGTGKNIEDQQFQKFYPSLSKTNSSDEQQLIQGFLHDCQTLVQKTNRINLHSKQLVKNYPYIIGVSLFKILNSNVVHASLYLFNTYTSKRVAELHGLATSATYPHKTLTVGTPLDKIKAYHYVNDEQLMQRYAVESKPFPLPSHEQAVIYAGNNCLDLWDKAVQAVPLINGLDKFYGVLTSNSNTVFRTLIDVMQLSYYQLSAVIAPGVQQTFYPAIQAELAIQKTQVLHEKKIPKIEKPVTSFSITSFIEAYFSPKPNKILIDYTKENLIRFEFTSEKEARQALNHFLQYIRITEDIIPQVHHSRYDASTYFFRFDKSQLNQSFNIIFSGEKGKILFTQRNKSTVISSLQSHSIQALKIAIKEGNQEKITTLLSLNPDLINSPLDYFDRKTSSRRKTTVLNFILYSSHHANEKTNLLDVALWVLYSTNCDVCLQDADQNTALYHAFESLSHPIGAEGAKIVIIKAIIDKAKQQHQLAKLVSLVNHDGKNAQELAFSAVKKDLGLYNTFIYITDYIVHALDEERKYFLQAQLEKAQSREEILNIFQLYLRSILVDNILQKPLTQMDEIFILDSNQIITLNTFKSFSDINLSFSIKNDQPAMDCKQLIQQMVAISTDKTLLLDLQFTQIKNLLEVWNYNNHHLSFPLVEQIWDVIKITDALLAKQIADEQMLGKNFQDLSFQPFFSQFPASNCIISNITVANCDLNNKSQFGLELNIQSFSKISLEKIEDKIVNLAIISLLKNNSINLQFKIKPITSDIFAGCLEVTSVKSFPMANLTEANQFINTFQTSIEYLLDELKEITAISQKQAVYAELKTTCKNCLVSWLQRNFYSSEKVFFGT